MQQIEKILLATLFAIFCSPTVLGWRSFKVVYLKFPYEFNTDFGDGKAQIVNNSAGDTALNIVMNLNSDIKDPLMGFAMALESETGNYATLYNRTVDLCKFLQERNAEPAMRLFYEDMLKHGNFIKACPLKKGSYNLREYHIDEEILPAYIPEANFFVDIIFSTPKKYIFKGRLHGKIDKSKGFDNLKMFSMG